MDGTEGEAEGCDASQDPARIAILRDEWQHILAIGPDRLREVLRRLREGELLEASSLAMGLHERTLRRVVQHASRLMSQ